MFFKARTEWKKKVEVNFRKQAVMQLWGSSSKSFVTCKLGADVQVLMTNQKVTEKASKINSASSP